MAGGALAQAAPPTPAPPNAAPPAAATPAAPAAPAVAEEAAVVVIDDGVGSAEPWGGAQAAVRAFTEGGARKAQLVAVTAAKAEETIRGLAQNHPAIIIVSATSGPLVEKLARDLPDNRLTLIGAAANGPNIRAIQFRDRETDWLGGWLAGKFTDDNDVGFVAAPDEGRRGALCAAAQGLAAAAPDRRMLPDLPAPDLDLKAEASRGAQLARSQIERGAGIVLTPAGAGGAGAMNAVRDHGALGVTRNTMAAALFPDNVLATQTRNYSATVLNALRMDRAAWQAGPVSVGFKEDAVALNVNEALLNTAPLEVREELGQLRAAIASGARTVTAVAGDGTCPLPTMR